MRTNENGIDNPRDIPVFSRHARIPIRKYSTLHIDFDTLQRIPHYKKGRRPTLSHWWFIIRFPLWRARFHEIRAQATHLGQTHLDQGTFVGNKTDWNRLFDI